MRVGVIGHTGFIGKTLIDIYPFLIPLELDVTQSEEVLDSVIHDADCSHIIYLAGYTNVDDCEQNSKKAIDINARGVSKIVSVFDGKLIYVSTDHVFDGRSFFRGYSEKHTPNPVNVYGATKLAGEIMAVSGWADAVVIRTSKVFNYQSIANILSSDSREFSNRLCRSYFHVEHFVRGIMWVVGNWNKIPQIIHISGKSIFTEYQFMCTVGKALGYDESEFIPRNKLLTDVVPRPIRGGLNCRLAEELGMPQYDLSDGLELLKNGR